MAGEGFHRFIAEVLRPLRLARDEHEALNDELRDHFAAYTNELTQLGLSDAEAEAAAQADFGPTNELAGAFLQIYRANRRRLIMRASAWGIGGMVTAVIVAWALLPESPRSVGPRQAIAQEDGRAPGSAATSPPSSDEGDEEESIEVFNRRTKRKLATRLEAQFEDTPLHDVLSKIADDLDIEMLPQRKELEEAGVGLDAPVSIKLKRVRGDVLLEFVLRQASPDAGYVVRDGIVLVSAKSALAGHQAIRVYNCRDLLAMAFEASQNNPPSGSTMMPMIGGGGGPAVDEVRPIGFGPAGGGGGSPGSASGSSGGSPVGPGAPAMASGGGIPGMPGQGRMGGGGMGGGGMMQSMGGMGGGLGGGMPQPPRTPQVAQLLRLIETTVAPESWEINGGPGTVEEFSGLLVVNQSEDVHDRIEKLLQMVREAGEK